MNNSESQSYWSTNGGNNTQDKIFLLSYAEANKYFGVTRNDDNNTKSCVEPTAYAIAQGAFTSSYYKTADGKATVVWWLRSPGTLHYNAACVYPDGSLYYSSVLNDGYCVRPAMWVDLSVISDMESKSVDNAVGNTEEIPTVDENNTTRNDVQVGSYLTFGIYPQTSEGTDETPIEWLVLDRDGNKALLISRYGLDAQPYNTEFAEVTWEKCTLRTWLNSTFMNKSFTSEEQKGIVLTSVDNSKSQGYSSWSTSGGNNTQDKIFLLSYAETNKYFGVTYNDSNNTKARVEPTAYAIVQGA